eukprot:GEZU01010355.1.p1 GENE.GEZU01010355.1~~GEZU01010355.1.p1  ORF type:complete len:271 (+),score=62.54 GEZU01010355.1:168-980(+)
MAMAVSYTFKPIEKFGVQVEKPPVVHVFRNGDKHHKGEEVVIYKKKFSNMDQLKKHLSTVVGVDTGAVMQVVRARDFKAIKFLEEFEDNELYVACGAERVNTERLSTVLKRELEYRRKMMSAEGTEDDYSVTSSSESASSKEAPTEPAPKKAVEKYGAQIEKARVIFVFRNGDRHHKGEKIVVNTKRIPTLEHLKDAMTECVRLVSGTVRQVYSAKDFKPVRSLDEIEDGAKYIACGSEPLNKDQLPKLIAADHVKTSKLNSANIAANAV